MDVEKLKQKILDLAIRGKLVPQDPNDEPASVLIEKIRAEKESLIKQGKIKRDKNESYIFKGDDNSYYEKVGKEIKKIKVPFEIPNTWQWVSLNEFGLFRKGPFGSSLTKEMFVPDSTPNRHKVYEQKNAIQKDWTLGNYYISDEKYKSMTSFVVEPNDIIVSCAGTIGEIFILPEDAEIGIINQALMRIRLYYKPLTDYFLMYFDAVLKQEASDKGKGTGMKNIPPFDVLKNMLFPLPTYEETIRILNKLTEISKFIEKIDFALKDICVLSEQLKFKILDSFFGENSRYKSYYENELQLGDILEYEQPAKYIVNSTDYSDEYATPVLTPGKTFILGYTDETDGIYKVNGGKVIIFDDFTTASRLVDFDFKVKSSAMKILTVSNSCSFDIEYFYYYLQTIHVNNTTHKRYWISLFSNLKVGVPPIDIQRQVVKDIKKIFSIIKTIEQP